MSLSQKDPGKVLVPWFNIAEWSSVRELIYSKINVNWPKALEILKVWKARTPLLSSGVEGTLIVLEALSVNKENLTNYEIVNIFSTALVRFLNLSAGNDRKQGTFYRKAKKNNLPKWLINLRHDIAHSHKLPSLFVLEYSLNFCLDWIKDKYWDIQHECMENFVDHNQELIENIVYAYVYLNFQLFYKPKIKFVVGELKARIISFIDYNGRKIRNNEEVLKTVQENLEEILADNPEVTANCACSLLVNDNLMLSTNYVLDNDGNKRIPEDFRLIWQYLITLLYEYGKLHNLICKLFEYTCSNENYSGNEVASLWIYEIFLGLLNQKENNENYLQFDSELKDELNARKFMEIALKAPNKFTLNYLNQVLMFNRMPKEFIEDSNKIVRALVDPSALCYSSNILTIHDLNIALPNNFNETNITDKVDCSSTRWQRVKDTSIYKNCPLGILPHQLKDQNPLLDIEIQQVK